MAGSKTFNSTTPTGLPTTSKQRSAEQIKSRLNELLGFINEIFDESVSANYEKFLRFDGSGEIDTTHAISSDVSLAHSGGNGTAGQVLQSDGDGTTSWLTFSGLTDGDKGDITVSGTGATFTINNDAVTTAKIIDDAVTTAKIIDDAVTTAKIIDDAVTQAKIGYSFTTKTTAYMAVNRDYIFADTDTTGAFTITLPASPSVGDRVYVNDIKKTFNTANLTLDRNSSNIEGAAEDFIIDIQGFIGEFYYEGASNGWVLI